MSMLISTQSSVQLSRVNALLASQLADLLALAVKSLGQDIATARGCIAKAAELLSFSIDPAVEPTNSISQGGLAAWQKQRLAQYVNQHIDGSIAIEDLAALVRLSSSYFSKAFRISFGCSPHAYVIERRIDRAKHLMLEGNASLTQISLECGFSDQPHFCRLFKRIAGETATVWRRERQLKRHSASHRFAQRIA